MRKIIFSLLLIATVAGAAAQTASADVKNPQYRVINYGAAREFTCITPASAGVFGQFGAWGDYVDGCTVQLSCPRQTVATQKCRAWLGSSIDMGLDRRFKVTQNARIRQLDNQQRVVRFKDRSCQGMGSCSNSTSLVLTQGQYASVQCNGVRQHGALSLASNTCTLRMDYEGG
jgi:hypothetical protein